MQEQIATQLDLFASANTIKRENESLDAVIEKPSSAMLYEKEPSYNLSSSSNKYEDSVTKTKSTKSNTLLNDYELIRSRRRTLSLSVQDGRLQVRAPMRAPLYWIKDTIVEKREWIEKQLALQSIRKREVIRIRHGTRFSLNDQAASICFCHLSEQCYIGANTRLHANNRSGKLVVEDNVFHFLFPSTIACDRYETAATTLFLSWLKRHADNLLTARFDYFGAIVDTKKRRTGLRFRMTKTSWGHCTSEGIIQLNPAIALAPGWVRDYVIVHELCHLTHANHSQRFWRLVEKHFAKWQEAEAWLDEQGHRVAVGQFT